MKAPDNSLGVKSGSRFARAATIGWLLWETTGAAVVGGDLDPVFLSKSIELPDVAFGSTREVLVVGEHAYVLSGYYEVQVVDIRDPKGPRVVGRHRISEEDRFSLGITGMTLSGPYGYLANSIGLEVVDFSDPHLPRQVSLTGDIPGNMTGLAEAAGHLYMIGPPGTPLQIFDTTDRAHPRWVGEHPTSGWRIRISGNVAFVVSESGVDLLDISTPRRPRQIGKWEKTAGYPRDLVIDGQHAYVSCLPETINQESVGSGLHILNIADPAKPYAVGYYEAPTPYPHPQLSLSGQSIFLAVDAISDEEGMAAGSVHRIDVGDPTHPRRLGIYQNGLVPTGIATVGNTCFYTSGRFGWSRTPQGGSFEVVDFSNPTDPQPLGRLTDDARWIQDAAVSGKYIYFADALGGLRVVDISDPQCPVPISRIDPGSGSSRVTVSGHLACVGVSGWRNGTDSIGSGLRVVNVADPRHPVLAGFLPMPIPLQFMVVQGKTCFVQDGEGRLRVIDLTNPSHPQLAATPNRSVGTFAVESRYLYTVGNDFEVLDITTPTQPRPVGRIGGFRNPSAVAVSGSKAVVVDRELGVLLIDISDPSQPRHLGRIGLSRGIRVRMAGQLACVSTESGGFLEILDISKTGPPRQVGKISDFGSAYAIAFSEGYIYSATMAGLNVIELNRPANPTRVDPQRVIADASILSATGIQVSEGFAYLASLSKGLQVIDVRNPAELKRVGALNIGALVRGVAVSQGFAYLPAGTEGFNVIDIKDPSKPISAAHVQEIGDAQSVTIQSGYAYVACRDRGLRVIDIRDPFHPQLSDNRVKPELLLKVTTRGTRYAYTVGSPGLAVYDISNPANPSEVGRFRSSDALPQDVEVSGRYAYMVLVQSSDSGWLQVIDLSDPRQPNLVSQCFIGASPVSIEVLGNYSYIAVGRSGVEVMDHSDPERPKRLGGNRSFLGGYDIALYGGRIWVAGDNNLNLGAGLTVLEMLPFFKNISVNAGQLSLTWEGWDRTRLETTMDLRNPVWKELQTPETNRLTLPIDAGNAFFRLKAL